MCEAGRAIQRLLVCYFDQDILEPVLPVLNQSLPGVEIALLTAHPTAKSANGLPKLVFTSLTGDTNSQQTLSSLDIIAHLQSYSFEAALIFTEPFQSPYTFAYLCYLAKIPVRIGQSQEFAGSTLSNCVTPPSDSVSPTDYQLHLLRGAGLLSVPGFQNVLAS